MNLGTRLRVGVVSAGVLLLVGACTSSTADGPTSSSATSVTATPSVIDPSSLVPGTSTVGPSPSPTAVETSTPSSSDISPQEAADRAAVEAAWAKFWEVSDNLTRIDEEVRRQEMYAVAIDPTLSQALADARSLDAKGREIYGHSAFHPYWEQSINGAATAVMGDCTDTSKSGARDKGSGEIRTVGVADNNTRATFVRESDGTWKVHEIFYLLDQPCP